MALARAAYRAMHGVRVMPSLTTGLRNMSIDIETFKDKETAEEAVFFSKQDEKLLRGLLKKIKKQVDASDEHQAAVDVASEVSDLKKIVGKYNMAESDLEDLLKWKHGH